MTRRLIPPCALIVVMLATASLVLGPPDIGGTIVFFSAGIPTLVAGEAVVAILAWMVVLVVATGALLSVTRALWSSRFSHHPSARSGLFLVAGLVLLTVSAIHRVLPVVSICCGSGAAAVREAVQLAH